jgi:hypothetical protein
MLSQFQRLPVRLNVRLDERVSARGKDLGGKAPQPNTISAVAHAAAI